MTKTTEKKTFKVGDIYTTHTGTAGNTTFKISRRTAKTVWVKTQRPDGTEGNETPCRICKATKTHPREDAERLASIWCILTNDSHVYAR